MGNVQTGNVGFEGAQDPARERMSVISGLVELDLGSINATASAAIKEGDVVCVDERTGRSIVATGKISGGKPHTGFAPIDIKDVRIPYLED